MGPDSLIVTALAAGVAASAELVVDQEVQDAYERLKALILSKFGSKGDVAQAMEQVESKPESSGRKELLKEELADAGVDQDLEVLQAAQTLLALLQPHATADRGSAVAMDRGAASVGSGNIQITGDVHGNVTISLDGRELRPLELAYLDNLLARERVREWRDGYVSLGGHAEVEHPPRGTAVRLPRRLARGYHVLMDRGFGPQRRTERHPVDDLQAAIARFRRVVLLGEPGSGKTTTLEHLAYEQATSASGNPRDPLPLLVDLGAYDDDGPLDPLLAQAFSNLGPHLHAYLDAGRVTLLLDALNEMPRADYEDRVRRVRALLDRYPRVQAVVTCRELDYPRDALDLTRIEISPLDEGRIRTFLHLTLGPEKGEHLYGRLGGITPERLRAWLHEKVHPGWRDKADAVVAEAPSYPSDAELRTYLVRCADAGRLGPVEWWRAGGWLGDRFDRFQASLDRPLLEMGRNPYLLGMLVLAYAEQGDLPSNRGALFDAFVHALLAREQETCDPARWIEANVQLDTLADLAFAMQAEAQRGTAVSRAWVAARLECETNDLDQRLYLARSASLLDVQDIQKDPVRFSHQLLQEYLAARGWERCIRAGDPLGERWPGGWWQPSGWEETALLLAGITEDLPGLIDWLLDVNPPLAVRCLLERDGQPPPALQSAAVERLLTVMKDEAIALNGRIQVGDALGAIGDPRFPRNRAADGTPYILSPLSDVLPAGSFWMGSAMDDLDAPPEEKPQHRAETGSYRIGLHPVTNAEYACFVRAGGYHESRHWTQHGWMAHSHAKGVRAGYWERRYWTEAGWSWQQRNNIIPTASREQVERPNHPVVEVSWYEATAYCRWLAEQTGWYVCLPSEAEWERAARDDDRRRYPWGDEFDFAYCNSRERGIRSTTPVGLFPSGRSPAGCHDMAGNVWEWTRSLWAPSEYGPAFRYPYRPEDGREDEEPGDDTSRVLRGGSWPFEAHRVRCTFRDRLNPRARVDYVGFRIVVSVQE